MDIREFVEEKVAKNHLTIDIDACLDTIQKYADIYPDATEIKRFFHYVLNKTGGILNAVDHDCAELFGNLKVKGRVDITFYQFDDEADYLEWQMLRAKMYAGITDMSDVRLVNYVEMSTMNMISDIFTKCMYKLIDTNGKVTYINKTGYGTDQDTQSFIKYMAVKFKEGYSFMPVTEKQ
jgi:hypothetical protein